LKLSVASCILIYILGFPEALQKGCSFLFWGGGGNPLAKVIQFPLLTALGDNKYLLTKDQSALQPSDKCVLFAKVANTL
jgi:hypothetical protein